MLKLRNIKKTEPSDLEKEIKRLFVELHGKNPDQPDYAAVVDQVVKLYPLQKVDNDNSKRVSSDALASIVGNLLGIVLITQHEYLRPIGSKAINLIGKKF